MKTPLSPSEAFPLFILYSFSWYYQVPRQPRAGSQHSSGPASHAPGPLHFIQNACRRTNPDAVTWTARGGMVVAVSRTGPSALRRPTAVRCPTTQLRLEHRRKILMTPPEELHT